jgi:hypothetical protein
MILMISRLLVVIVRLNIRVMIQFQIRVFREYIMFNDLSRIFVTQVQAWRTAKHPQEI